MNENIFEVLIYLFENYMIDDFGSTSVRADIEDELIRMGFSNYDVGSAFGWLEGLIEQCTKKDLSQIDELDDIDTFIDNDADRSVTLKTNGKEDKGKKAVSSSMKPSSEKQRDYEQINTAAFHLFSNSNGNVRSSTNRYYLSSEMRIISVEIRGLLFTLEQNNMIDHEVREIIIDRIMALSNDQPLSTDKAKWIVMMVLVNCHASSQENNHLLDFAESFVFNDVLKH